MPIRESVCSDPTCRMCDKPVEHYYHRSDTPLNRCDACGGETKAVPFSRFAVVFSGELGANYVDRSKEGGEAKTAAHWAWRQRSSLSGKPEPVFIETFQQQREFAKAEGLLLPKEMPNNYVVKEDGKSLANTCGMPGTEV
jgi:predicted nucleic acid-binding Zn ribbon protein